MIMTTKACAGSDCTLQDDLAEHTMQSPVWLDSDPSWDVGEVISDWEYYSDDYYDQDSAGPKSSAPSVKDGQQSSILKGKRNPGSRRPVLKRKRGIPTNEIPALSLLEPVKLPSPPWSPTPVVRWRSNDSPPRLPLLIEGEGEKVALLADWKERFLVPKTDGPRSPHSRRSARGPIPAAVESQGHVSKKTGVTKTNNGVRPKRKIPERDVERALAIDQSPSKPRTDTVNRKRKAPAAEKTVNHADNGKKSKVVCAEASVEPIAPRKSKRLKR